MARSTNPKTYTYHSSKNGVFQGIFTNIISDFNYQQEINSSGSVVTVVLGTQADNFGEGTVVDFNNKVQIYEIDDTNVNGALIFQGFIINYKPFLTDTNQEQVEVTLMGYGITLNDYVIETGQTADVIQNSQNTSSGIGGDKNGSNSIVQSFTTGGSITKLSGLQFQLAAATNPGASNPIGSNVICEIYSSQSDAESAGHTNVLATTSLPIASAVNQVYTFTFATPLTVTSAATYWARLTSDYINTNSVAVFTTAVNVYSDNTSPYSGGIGRYQASDVAAFADLGGDLFILTYSSTGSTSSTYSSSDPSTILKSIIDNYNTQGGMITYTASSIDLTNTSVNYTFNANTVLEGINKCLDLAPPGWYWYIDQVNNILHFHHQSSSAQQTFTLGKNIRNLAVEKRAQDIVNIVYFIGGPTGGVNLYKKSTLQSSVNLYGRHAIRWNDNNVTDSATAGIISNSILTERSQVELRIDIDIIDDGGNTSSGLGFDIESVTLGESVGFRSLGVGTGATLWDVAKWDVAKWDFDITDLTSVVVQVTKIDYRPDILHLSLSSVPPDITKRVEYIYRGLQQVNALNNPSIPS